jgi:uncharacterized NAD(P)/FAD-binding protein YdhS
MAGQKYKKIAIVGGGASGALTALHLASKFGERVEISIFEKTDAPLGAGRAYANPNPEYLLNVPVEKMGYQVTDPGDFSKWVNVHHPEAAQDPHFPFVARAWYLEYLNGKISRLSGLKRITGEVRLASYEKKKWKLKTERGFQDFYDAVFVATGYEERLDPEVFKLGDKKVRSLIFQPYEKPAEKLRPKDDVIVVGAGLTAFDVWRNFRQAGRLGKVTLISRHGLIPTAHLKSAPVNPPLKAVPNLSGMTSLQILRVLRAIHRSSVLSLPETADQVRTQTSRIWGGWDENEKSRFLKHLARYWEIIRHRLPGTILEDWNAEVSSQSAALMKGKILQIKSSPHGVAVKVKNYDETLNLKASAVILASGFRTDQESLRFKIPQGLVQKCPFGFGFRKIRAPGLWFVGPASKTEFWEVTAVPDIRVQLARFMKELELVLG